MTTIRDSRTMMHGTFIKDMKAGTWFVTNCGLFLKVAVDICVDVASGKQTPFNEDHPGQPVEVTVTIEEERR